MRLKKFKKVVATLAALAMCIVAVGAPIEAKAEGAELGEAAQAIKQLHEGYRENLEQVGAGSKFAVYDMYGDGNAELLILCPPGSMLEGLTYLYHPYASMGEGMSRLWVGQGEYSTKYFKVEFVYEDDGNEYGGGTVSEYYIFEVGEPLPGSSDCMGWVVNAEGEYLDLVGEELSQSVVAEWEAEYMKNPVELVANLDVTEENLNKYLPVDDAVLANLYKEDITTAPVKLKVGDVFLAQTAVIDELLKDTGSGWPANQIPRIYWAEEVVSVTEGYLRGVIEVGVHDSQNNSKLLDSLFATEDEFDALIERWENGSIAKQYGVEKVMLVEAGEGLPLHFRAEKAGSASIVIPEYEVGGGRTIKVTIPVEIEGKSTTIKGSVATGIEIDNASETLPKGTVLQVAPISPKNDLLGIYEKAEAIVDKNIASKGQMAVYKIDLLTSKGAELHQLNGKIKVRMYVPFELEQGNTMQVLRVVENSDEAVECPSSIEGDYLTFETDHFSTYIFVEVKTEANAGAGTTGTTSPKTADGLQVGMYVGAMIVGIALCGVVVFEKKRKRA